MKDFENFLYSVHPDPDTLYAKTVEQAYKEIAALANHYHSALGVTHCKFCGNEIREIIRGKTNGLCEGGFTSNA